MIRNDPVRLPIRVQLPLAALAVAPLACAAPADDSADDPADATDQGIEVSHTEVAEGVYQLNAGSHNAFFVDTDGGVVAFDPISIEAAVGLAVAIRSAAPDKPLAAIVYSHSDADHATGAPVLRQAFGGDVPIIAQENAFPIIVAGGNPDLPPPDLTFADEMTLRFGGRAIELHYLGPSHTDNLLVALVPDAGVLFAVDFVSNDRVGYRDLPGWHFDDLYVALDRLMELPFETVVFGHGAVGDRGTIERQLAYYADLRDAVQAAVDEGLSEEEAMAQVRLDDYAHWGQYEAWFPMNVGAVYRWLAGS
ncbi:MAG: MBL fold metallo-hydrolase [Gemmatimonadetes bacterium]|nr:MBL fold metallo-hydrolase [Gemmatimonadota bacterium]